MEVNVSGWV